MLTNRKFLAIFCLALLPFLYYSLRSDITGYDSYHYLNLVCGIEEGIAGELLGTQLALSCIPCNILAIKFVMFVSYFLSLLAIVKLGELFDDRHGWLAALFLSLGIVFLRDFTQFENEIFAFPVILWATYYFYRKTTWQNQYASLFLFAVASQFWGASWLMFVVLALISFDTKIHDGKITFFVFKKWMVPVQALPNIAIAFHLLVKSFEENIHILLPNLAVKENSIIYSVPSLLLLPLGMIGLGKFKRLVFPGFVFLVIALVNPKFAFFAVPFLAIGLTQTMKMHRVLPYFFVPLAIFLALFSPIVLLFQEPTQPMLDAIDYAVELADGNNMQNNWGIGYMVLNRGGITRNISGGNHVFSYEGIILTRKNGIPCPVLREFDGGIEGKWKVYRC